MNNVIKEVKGLYRIIPLKNFRRTPGVHFDVIPKKLLPRIDGIDRVIHTDGAISPGPVGGVVRPWYMHTHQDDNLLVLHGVRYVELYTHDAGRILQFTVRPDQVIFEGQAVSEEACMLVWPRGVFHRVQSDPELGSASVNLATRYEGIDMETNFSIYDIDFDARTHRVIRRGNLDQVPI